MTERSQSKAERLLQLEQILLAFPEGLRKAEIARRLGVHRATVGRYIEELSQRLPIWEEGNLVGINRDDYLTHVRLTIHESMVVHLAARLMATRTDKHNPHAAAALRKLGQALEGFAPLISQHLLASAEVMDDAARRHDPVYLEVLETLTRAWSQGGWCICGTSTSRADGCTNTISLPTSSNLTRWARPPTSLAGGSRQGRCARSNWSASSASN